MATGVDLILLLQQAAHALDTELAAGLAEIGVSVRGFCVLQKALAGERTQIQLSELCALDKTTMVLTLDELEKTGLAERRTIPSDRRARIIAVTKAGKRIVTEGEGIIAGVYADVLGTLSSRSREAFVESLVTLVGGRLAAPVRTERPVRRARRAS